MKYIILTVCVGLFAASCITQKKAKKQAYDNILTDVFRDPEELAKLNRAFKSAFPDYRDTPIVKIEIDSSEYLEYMENQKLWLEQVIIYNRIIDSLEALPKYDSVKKILVPGTPKCRMSAADSASIIKQYLDTHRPPPVKENKTVDTPIKNDGDLAEKKKELSDCENENNALRAVAKDAVDKRAKTKTANIFLWVVSGVLAIGHAVRIFRK